MYENHSKYELNEDGKFDVYYKGWDYGKWKSTGGWTKVSTVETEDDAKRKCADLLPSED